MNSQNSLQFGTEIILQAEQLAGHTDDPGTLTVAYLTRAHQTAGAEIVGRMITAGMQVRFDAVGNVIGRYPAADADAPILMAGSHFDTVRNGGRFDGRLGILAPIAVARHLHERGERLPFHFDVVAFAEEEGVRFRSSFLASSALVGQFDYARLDHRDADGTLGVVPAQAGTQ
jgi:N-carbamoyl-L-amino-acid hydrolase